MSDLGQRVYRAALAWHEAGASVVPCSEKGGKRPALDWKPLVINRLSQPALRGYLSAGGRDGFGILLGYGGFEMFEVEGRAVFDDTLVQFLQLMRDNAPELLAKLSAGYVEHTPSGGIHWIYLVDGAPARNKKLAENEKGECLIETRGEGGFVVLAPSGGRTHLEIPNGEWKTSRTPADVVTITVEEREKLYAVAQMLDRNVRPDAGLGPTGERRELVARGEGSPVDDYNANGDWAILLEYGWKIVSKDDRGTTYWLRPGKTDFSENVHSATTREGSPNLYIFSTSVKGLAPEVPHSRAFVRAHYKHGGDMKACRAELAGRGFGKPEGDRTSDWAAADKVAWAEERALVAAQAKAALANAFATPEQIEAAEAVLAAAVEALQGGSSWEPQDITGVAEGRVVREPAHVLCRTDRICGWYSGKVNGLIGESEAGKTWVALYACAQQLDAGETVMFIDFEDDAVEVVGRLRILGVSAKVLVDRFIYIAPEDPWNEDAQEVLFRVVGERLPALIMIDAWNAAMGGSYLDFMSQGEVISWSKSFLRPLAKTGACVVVLDHVTKATAQGLDGAKGGIGPQAKRAEISGCQLIATVTPSRLTPGKRGALRLMIDKDRGGGVRAVSEEGYFGTFVMDAEPVQTRWHDEQMSAAIFGPNGAATAPQVEAPHWGAVHRLLKLIRDDAGQSQNALLSDPILVSMFPDRQAKAAGTRALAFLEERGLVEVKKQGTGRTSPKGYTLAGLNQTPLNFQELRTALLGTSEADDAKFTELLQKAAGTGNPE